MVTTDLTEDQVRAYRLADNKTNESDWDHKALDLELPEIEIDMSEFDFDLSVTFEERHERDKENTRGRVLDIVNLGGGQFRGAGLYDIPVLSPVFELPPIKEWIGFNYVLTDDEPEGKAVHFFIDDYQFERLWNAPEKYVDRLRRYVCVASPDFSPYGDMPHALQIYNHYRKHWVAAWLQVHGVTVIPTIRCSTDKRSLEWYLDGEPRGGVVVMSSMWTKDNGTADVSREEYTRMKKTLEPKKIFIYGGESENMGIEAGDNVEYIKNFTQGRWNK